MRRLDKRRKPRKAHVRHILVASKPDVRELLDQIQSARNPLKVFKKLAKKYSNCSSASKKGDLGEFVEGQMVQRFEEAVWAMVPKRSRVVIKTQFGYHIVWVHEIILPE